MSITTTYEGRDGYLFMKVEGTFDVTEGMSQMDEWIQEARNRGYTKLLRDVTGVIQPHPSHDIPIDIYKWATSLATRVGPQLRIAVLSVPTRSPDTQFFEHVARNRGASIQFFTSFDDALAFLEVKK